MTFAIADQVFIKIKIEGEELKGGASAFGDILMTEGGGALFPSLKLQILDRASLISLNKSITDGCAIEITVSRRAEDASAPVRQYRVFSVIPLPTVNGQGVEIVGVADAPQYVSESVSASYNGLTSEDALRKIAETCKLKFYGPTDFNGRKTSDKQTWLSVMRTRAVFARDIAMRGWMDDTSGMALMLDSLGTLKYLNIQDVLLTPLPKVKYQILHSTTGDKQKVTYLTKEVDPRSLTGLMTSWMNYGSHRLHDNLTGNQDKHKTLDVKTNDPFLPIHKGVKDTIQKSRVDYAPLDCGNTNEKYEQAMYQNIRQLALLTERVGALITDVSEIELFEPVIYRQANADYTQPLKETDTYFCLAKTILVKGGTYYAERIELAKMGVTMEGITDLSKPNSSEAQKTMMPSVSIQASVAKDVYDGTMTKAAQLGVLAKEINTNVAILDAHITSVVDALDSAVAPLNKLVNAINSGINAAIEPALIAANEALSVVDQVQQAASTAVGTALSTVNSVIGSVTGEIDSVKNLLVGGVGDSIGVLSKSLQLTQLNGLISGITTNIQSSVIGKVAYLPMSNITALAQASGLRTLDLQTQTAATWNKLYQTTSNLNPIAKYNDVAATTLSGLNSFSTEALFKQAVANSMLKCGNIDTRTISIPVSTNVATSTANISTYVNTYTRWSRA